MIFLCRYGGEEFVLILNNTSKEDAIKIGEDIRKSIDEFSFEGEEFTFKRVITLFRLVWMGSEEER